MMKDDISQYLTNQFLIAMPHINDPEFSNTMVYMVSHNAEGAMGLVINQPKPIHLVDVLEQLQPNTLFPTDHLFSPIYSGGPIDPERGFVLHEKGIIFDGTVELDTLNITSSLDILFGIANNEVKTQYLIILGYAAWEAGQLEQELLDNVWLTCPYQEEVLFKVPAEERIDAAMSHLGVSLSALSTQVGHA